MPDVREFQPVVESAERAAAAGDFAGAEALLREAAALQEASLGPRHPDLASTYNNLAVACEMADKPADAEQFFRRAYAIAASALGPEHALVVTSRDNLRDFCKARGLSFEELEPGAVPSAAVPTAAAPARVARPKAPARPSVPAGINSSRRLVAALLILAVLSAIAVARQWLAPSREPEAPASAAVRDGAQAPVPAAPPPAAPPPAAASADAASASADAASTAPLGGARPAAAPPASRPVTPVATAPQQTAAAPGQVSAASEPPVPTPTRTVRASGAPVRAAAPSGAAPAADVRVVTATVCHTLTTAAGVWRCDAASADSGPGRFSYLTRIASPRPVRVRHRWYQGDLLRQDVGLAVGASPSEGYRTFSRQTVSAGEWRVDLVAENGAVLDSTRFVVR